MIRLGDSGRARGHPESERVDLFDVARTVLSPTRLCAAIAVAAAGLAPSTTRARPMPLEARAIQNAIDKAAPGSVVQLPEGHIYGELRVDKRLTVRGRGRDRTTFFSRGRRAVLMVGATDGPVVIQGVSFTTAENAEAKRGAGVMLGGPGKITLRDVGFRRTIRGRCLSSAIALRDRPRVRMERVHIEGHHCFMAGAMVIDAGARVAIYDSVVEDNAGELAGAFYVAGGTLIIERSILRGNRFARGDDGHHLVFGSGPSRARLVATELATDVERSIAFEEGAEPAVAVARMPWPEAEQPAFVQLR